MTPAQRRAFRLIPQSLRNDIARHDDELAAVAGLTQAEMRQVLMILYRQHVVDFGGGYVFLPVQATSQGRAA